MARFSYSRPSPGWPAGQPLSGDLLQAEVAGIILGGLDTSAQTCAFTLCVRLHMRPSHTQASYSGQKMV